MDFYELSGKQMLFHILQMANCTSIKYSRGILGLCSIKLRVKWI